MARKASWASFFWPERGSEPAISKAITSRSEEHTSELQSRQYLVCRLLLEKKKFHSVPFVALDPTRALLTFLRYLRVFAHFRLSANHVHFLFVLIAFVTRELLFVFVSVTTS